MLTEKNQKYFFIPIFCLTFLTIIPLFNLILSGFHYEATQKTRLTPFMITPGVPVFSTDDFFEYVFFEAETQSGKIIQLKWQDLVDKRYENNFLYYVYLRHIFNSRTNANRSKDKIIMHALKSGVCSRHLSNEIISSVQYNVSFPLDPTKIKKSIRVRCDE